jgi:hypothetical protein
MNESMELQNLVSNLDGVQQVHCIALDHVTGARVWNGEEITPGAFILKLMKGHSLHLRVFFTPFAMAEYTVPLDGLDTLLDEVFGVTTVPTAKPANATVDRVAIRSMVEDFWRSFISLAVDHPEMGMKSIQRFDEQIQATAMLMESSNAQKYLQAVEEERDVLFQEYNRNPESLKRRLGLSHPTPVAPVHYHRQGMGEMVVRTAVRATIWESVFSLFRLFR